MINKDIITEDALSRFIDEAMSHVGESNKWVCTECQLGENNPWSGAFVYACAKQVDDLVGTIFPKTTNVTSIASLGTLVEMGKWVASNPEMGDIVLFRTGDRTYHGKYDADRAGIVTEVVNGTIYTVEGDCSGKVATKSYGINTCKTILGYYRPDWSRVDADVVNHVTYTLNDEPSTRHDALLREVGYLNSKYEPSIHSSNILLSVINYTNFLAELIDAFDLGEVEQLVEFDSDATGKLTNNKCRIVVEHLLSRGLNMAASIGVAANIYAESGFDTGAIGDNGTSFGICQWHNNRGTAMKSYVGSDWSTNLTGQLDYLWYELTCTSEKKVMPYLEDVPDTLSGAKEAADAFVRIFERPRDVEGASITRQKYAEAYWDEVTRGES